MEKKRTPLPRVDQRRKLVMVYSTSLNMFEVNQITNKGLVSKAFAPQIAITDDIHQAFKRFTVPAAGFKAVPGVDKSLFKTWNEFIQGVWAKATGKVK